MLLAHISTSQTVVFAVFCIVAVKYRGIFFSFLCEYSFGNACMSAVRSEVLEYDDRSCRRKSELENQQNFYRVSGVDIRQQVDVCLGYPFSLGGIMRRFFP